MGEGNVLFQVTKLDGKDQWSFRDHPAASYGRGTGPRGAYYDHQCAIVMGCASSGPVGKVADSVADLASKEGKAVQDFGTATKDTLISGVNHVNEMVGTAFKSAEHEVVNLTSKATNFLGHAEEDVKEAKKEKEQFESNVSENVNEAISDAETVVMSEVGNLQNEADDIDDELMEVMRKDVADKTGAVARMEGDNLILEDIEHFDHLGEAVEKSEKRVERLMEMEAEDLKDMAHKEEPKKEE
ncbi:uncharacterized protein LOC123318907 [Coccinella septempunctata]|uniref:uncharacterized protein LOC123318907 n=1 Tax=Coccinella septempunctata TaxID=41139 RepID=UPI001D061B32|nr:uncharacterized protein LOC123318907 [Coccinella septempunctata]